LDDLYLGAAIHYVGRNPVRANMHRKAERYPWSSAAAHCGIKIDGVLTKNATWRRKFNQITAWLAEGEEQNKLTVLRRNIERDCQVAQIDL